MMASYGCLLYSGDTCMAFDFATGLFPADFCIFSRDFAQTNEGTERRFMMWFHRFCSHALWWPIWSATSCPDNDSDDSNTSDNKSESTQNGTDDVTGYCSDIDKSGSNNSDTDDDDVHDGDNGPFISWL